MAGEHSTTEPTMLDGCEVTLYCKISTRKAVVAEWLRRLTRNQFPSGSVGSNPTNCVKDFLDAILDTSLSSILPVQSMASSHRFLDSLVVRISACHVEGPGSIPGRGEIFSLLTKSFVAPGEARTHNPGITLCTVYKYRALTDCATGAYCRFRPKIEY